MDFAFIAFFDPWSPTLPKPYSTSCGDYWKQLDFSTNFYIDAYQKICSISVSSQPVNWPGSSLHKSLKNNPCWSQIPVPTSKRQTTERCLVCAQRQVAAGTHSLLIRSPAVSHVFSQHLCSNFQGDWLFLAMALDHACTWETTHLECSSPRAADKY